MKIAVLRSRGATTMQIIGMAGLEGSLLELVGLAGGHPVVARSEPILGQDSLLPGFHRQYQPAHSHHPYRPFVWVWHCGDWHVCPIGAIILGNAGIRSSLIQRTRWRTLRRALVAAPAWSDLMLFVPAAYGAYLLRTQGGGALADPFQNPLLLLVPALGIFALTLFLLRILPLFMTAFAWIASRTKSVGILLAARHLSACPGYIAPHLSCWCLPSACRLSPLPWLKPLTATSTTSHFIRSGPI